MSFTDPRVAAVHCEEAGCFHQSLRRGVLLAVSCLVLALSAAAAPTISYTQGNYAAPQSPQTSVTITFTAPQAAGDLNVVVVGWNDSTVAVSSVTDSKGNSYQGAVGPTIVSGLLSQAIYYAKNIVSAAAGTNVVTVRFSGAATFPDIRILEYSGADLNSPVDVTAVSSGIGGTSNSGTFSTTSSTDLIFGANTVRNATSGPGSGFTQRLLTVPDRDIAEDRMVTAAAVYNAAAPVTGGSWIMQMVAFRTPVATGDTQPPTAPANLTASAASGSQINLSWTASTDNVGVTGYRVERCQGMGCSSFAPITTVAATTYSDTGLVANTSYTYRVRARDAAGNLSSYSNTATATTLATTGSGLVAAYSFDEGTGTTVTDLSGNRNTGTLRNTTWTSAGKYGNALVFNGSSSWVTISDSSSLHLTSSMTLEAWVNPSSITRSWRDVIYKGNDNYFLEATSYQGSVPPGGGGTFGPKGGLVLGTASLAANTWAHLALTYDGAVLRLYVNGVQVSSVSQTGNLLTSNNPLQIGGDSIFGQYFAGTIDEVRVYNTALTQSQIQADMATPVGGGNGAQAGNVSVSLTPTSVALNPGQTQQFAATVAGTTNQSVTWSATFGTISSSGVYTAPSVSSTSTATVKATSVANTTKSASATVTIQPVSSVQHTVDLSWRASTSPNVISYNVYRGTVSGGPYIKIASGIASTLYTDSTVSSGQTYYYVTTAVDNTGQQSTYSNQTTAVIPTP